MNTEDQTVHVIDDDEAVRDSIGMVLDTAGITFRLYETGDEFLRACTPELAGCVVLDVRMPGMTGLEVQDALRSRQSTLPIIFITGHGDVPMAVEAMRRGALDFLRKPFADEELLSRIREALAQDSNQRANRALYDRICERFATLSPREREVFERVAAGQANKVVAIELAISERTVEIHRAQAMKKMEARTLADLVRMKLELDHTSS